jgi:hypothetical protein
MKIRTESEMEEAIAKHQMLGLCVGIAVVMIVVWLTLPGNVEQEANKTCLISCTELINTSNGEIGVNSGPIYFEEIGKCHAACTKESRENID